MKTFQKIKEVLEEAEKDAEKFDAGNSSAGTRLRKKMLEIGKLTKEVRKEVSDIKNA